MKYNNVPDVWIITYLLNGELRAEQFVFDSYTFNELINRFTDSVNHDRIISVVGA